MQDKKDNILYTKPAQGAIGKERRYDLQRELFVNQAEFPRGVVYEDIDAEMKRWVNEDLSISYDGQKLPSFFLMSAQRLQEYSATWRFNDTNGGLLLNFVTLTREKHPKFGTGQNQYGNIPGDNLFFTIGYKSVVENSIETTNRLSMRQPKAIDIIYSVSIFTFDIRTLNKFNEMVQDKFKSLECYIRPNNGHYLPLLLDNVEDQSKTDIEDRRFYSQTFQIKCMQYIINPETDFREERLMTRYTNSQDADVTQRRPEVIIEDASDFHQHEVKLNVDFKEEDKNIQKFEMDETVFLTSVEQVNIQSFSVKVDNDERYVITMNENPRNINMELKEHEHVCVSIKRENKFSSQSLSFHGTNHSPLSFSTAPVQASDFV